MNNLLPFARFWLIVLFLGLIPLWGNAQATCPADMVVCSGQVTLSGASPAGGVYSGPGVSNGVFDANQAGGGTHIINYTYADNEGGIQQCRFSITVARLTCQLDIATIGLHGAPWEIAGCFAFPDVGLKWSGPGVVDNILYPEVAGVGGHFMIAAIEGGIGCPTLSYTISIEEERQTYSLQECMEDRVVDRAWTPPFELVPPADLIGNPSFRASFSGPGVTYISSENKYMFDPVEANDGENTISLNVGYFFGGTWSSFYNLADQCQFKIVVGSMPVTLSGFTAASSEHNVLLNWETTAETNFDRFEIERSTDPRKGFERIHTLAGGNANGNRYSHTDGTAPRGVLTYYRLKMVDLDGSVAYSRIEGVLLEGDAKQVTVYPNPASRLLNVESKIAFEEVRLLTVNGAEVWNTAMAASKKAELKLPGFPAGAYFLRVKNVDNTVSYSRVLIE